MPTEFDYTRSMSALKEMMRKLEILQQAIFFVLVIAGISVLVYLFFNTKYF